jgi:hypothetical protein
MRPSRSTCTRCWTLRLPAKLTGDNANNGRSSGTGGAAAAPRHAVTSTSASASRRRSWGITRHGCTDLTPSRGRAGRDRSRKLSQKQYRVGRGMCAAKRDGQNIHRALSAQREQARNVGR